MLTIRKNDSLDVVNGSFVDAIIKAATSFVALRENPNKGEYELQHPFIAFFAFLRRLRAAENKRERDDVEREMRADGITDEKAIDEARRAIKASKDNGRVTVDVLRRLHGETRGTGAPIVLTEGSEDYQAAVKLLKKSVGGWQGHIDADTFQAVCSGLSLIFANAKESTVTALDLGFSPESMETFLKGEPLQIVEAIETESTNDETEG